MKLISISICLLILFFSTTCMGQVEKTTRDIGLWTGVGIKYKINKKWTSWAKQEVRTFDNAARLRKSVSEVGANYKIDQRFKLNAGLRYAYNRKKNNTFSHNIRYNIDFIFKSELVDDLDLIYRFRYQNNYERPFTGFSDYEVKGGARNRLKLEKEFKKHAIYISSEIFREYIYYRKPSFNSLRLALGDEIETKRGDFEYGLYYERELNKDNPLHYFFLKLNYTFNFKRG